MIFNTYCFLFSPIVSNVFRALNIAGFSFSFSVAVVCGVGWWYCIFNVSDYDNEWNFEGWKTGFWIYISIKCLHRILAIQKYMWRSWLYTVSHVGEDVYRYVRSTVSVSTVIIKLELSFPSSVVEVTFLKSTECDKIKSWLKNLTSKNCGWLHNLSICCTQNLGNVCKLQVHVTCFMHGKLEIGMCLEFIICSELCWFYLCNLYLGVGMVENF